MTATVSTTVSTLDVPGARLHFEVRGQGPLVALVGAPMDAGSFAALADLIAGDHTVLTTDSRGIRHSPLDDPAQDSTPRLRADDLSRLLAHVDAGPAVVFGSSGGAVTALTLAQARPEQVRGVVAHEPPLIELLPDRDELHRQTDELIAAYLSGDVVGAWAGVMGQAGITVPDGALEMMFGGPRDPRDVADERRWFAHELHATTHWAPDLDRLRATPGLVIGIGEESAGQLCDRASRALGQALGLDPVLFPGDHTGFADDPDAFAPVLRAVLDRLR
ncbi:alpha/beta fold hydrolase [Nonomuraea sp. NPDC049655]|uniref:alpha/beta fold hydrolase n=1 Tax=Nonomuraea sp. NPDC049655 TaxID=3364355 RepID=UPI003796E1E3